MQDRSGPDSDYLAPGTWYLTPMPHSPIYRGEIQNLFKTKVHSGQACKPRVRVFRYLAFRLGPRCSVSGPRR
jgi:hypothetical protein